MLAFNKKELINYLFHQLRSVEKLRLLYINNETLKSYWEGQESAIRGFIERFKIYTKWEDIHTHLNYTYKDLQKKEHDILYLPSKSYLKGCGAIIDATRQKIREIEKEEY